MHCMCPSQSTMHFTRWYTHTLTHTLATLVSINHWLHRPESQGNMVIIDWFSKSLCLIYWPGFPTSFETADLIFTNVFHYYGIREDTVSDWGTQDLVWFSFMEKLGVSVSLTSGYHPQACWTCWICWTGKPRHLPFLKDILWWEPRRLGPGPPLGWVCPDLTAPLRHAPDSFPVCAWLATTPVSLKCYP